MTGAPLSAKTLRLIRLIAAITAGDWQEVARVRGAAPDGEPDRAWRETVLMTHLLVGIPRQIKAYEILATCGGLGVIDSDEGSRAAEPPPSLGEGPFERIYGRNATSVRRHLDEQHPAFSRWVYEHAYGRVLARDGLSLLEREFCIVAALIILEQPKQVAGHVRGATLLGASQTQLEAVVAQVASLASVASVERASDIIHRFATESQSELA